MIGGKSTGEDEDDVLAAASALLYIVVGLRQKSKIFRSSTSSAVTANISASPTKHSGRFKISITLETDIVRCLK